MSHQAFVLTRNNVGESKIKDEMSKESIYNLAVESISELLPIKNDYYPDSIIFSNHISTY